MLVQNDGAGPHRQVQPELAPGGQGGRDQEYKPEYPGGGNVQRQPATAVDPGKVITRLGREKATEGLPVSETAITGLCHHIINEQIVSEKVRTLAFFDSET